MGSEEGRHILKLCHSLALPLKECPRLSSFQGMARYTYLRQLRDLNEPLEVLKVAGAVEQIFQPRDGGGPEGAGVFTSPKEEGSVQPPSFPPVLAQAKGTGCQGDSFHGAWIQL